jgi:DNA-binding transcriptional ArsR family regulator
MTDVAQHERLLAYARVMRRDAELVRELLLEIEKQDGRPKRVEIDGYSQAEIDYHGRLLAEAGLVKVTLVDGGPFMPKRLTNAGHDVVDAVREESGWRAILGRARPTAEATSTAIGLIAQLRQLAGV